MSLNRFFIYFLVSIFICSQSFAADYSTLKKLFESTWTTNYVESKCGLNIENLVSQALDSGIDLDGAQIVALEDKGGFRFGMVNAVQARGATRFGPGEKNWFFHVFLLVDGKVLDYDFMNTPKILPFSSYMYEMYVPAERWNDLKYKESKFRLYEFKFYPAEDYILRLRQRLSREEIAVNKKLKDYMPSFFTAR